jgi:hypothetical protein
LNVASVRRDFPILGEHENSNVHRAAHELAARAADAYELGRASLPVL